MSHSSSRLALVINTTSRKGERSFRQAVQLLEEAGFEVIPYPLRNPKKLSPVVREIVASGVKIIVIGGGDGTISEVVDHVAYTNVTVGILPLGTANSFSRSLGIPAELSAAVEIISAGKTAIIDLGKINDDYFANAVSIGFASTIAENIPHLLKRYTGILAYAIQCLWNLPKLRPFQVKVYNQEVEHTLETYQLVIANGSYYGPASLLSKQALQNAGVRIFTFKDIRPLGILKIWLRSVLGRKFSQQPIQELAIEEGCILMTDPPQKVSIDGEIKTETPIRVSVAAKALKVFVAENSPFTLMKPLLIPDQRCQTLFDIDWNLVQDRQYLIIDADNTLVLPCETGVLPTVVNLFTTLRAEGKIKDLCIVSNIGFSTRYRMKRLQNIAEQLNARYVGATAWFSKPHLHPFKQALAQMGASSEETIMIGDQIFTDIRGGNRLGLYTILVKPLGKDRFWPTRYRRWLERRLPK